MEIEKVRENVAKLSENEAKSLLMIIYAGLDTTINGNGGDEKYKEILSELFDTYKNLPSK